MPFVFCYLLRICKDTTDLKIAVNHLEVCIPKEIVSLLGKAVTVWPQLYLPEPTKEKKQVADLNTGILVYTTRRISLTESRCPSLNSISS